RQREPVHHDRVLERWVLSRPADVDRVLRDRTMSGDPRQAREGTYMPLFTRSRPFSMLFQDPPAHTRLRGLVSKAFTPRAVERLAPRMRQTAHDLLAAVARRERFDVIESFDGA